MFNGIGTLVFSLVETTDKLTWCSNVAFGHAWFFCYNNMLSSSWLRKGGDSGNDLWKQTGHTLLLD